MKALIHRKNAATVNLNPTSPHALQILPLMEGRRRWDNTGRFAFEPTDHNINLLRSVDPHLEVEDQTTPNVFSAAFSPDPTPRCAYESKTEPFSEQKIVEGILKTKSRFALFGEQGTGKTKPTIDKAGLEWCRGTIDALLIIAPKGVHRQWIEQQIPTHLGNMVDWVGGFWRGKPPSNFENLLQPDGRLSAFAIGYDAAKTKSGIAACKKYAANFQGRLMVVADESHNIKNNRSARWKAADEIAAGAVIKMILTGTPIAKDLTDEWSQLKWLDEKILGIKYATTFRAQYCVMGGYEMKQVVGHRNWQRFRSKVDPVSYRMTKDNLGLPPKVYEEVRFDLKPVQKGMIKTLKDDLLAQIDGGELITAANAVVASGKFQQISRGFIIEKLPLAPGEKRPKTRTHSLFGKPRDNPSIDALLDIIDSYGDRRIAIWAHHNYDIEAIIGVLDDRAVNYYGATSDEDRAAAVAEFTNPDSNVQFFIANQASGGTGLNLQICCYNAIYYSNSYKAIDRWQSEDRIHRIGTKLPVTYTDMIAVGGKDRGILSNIRRKKTISEMAIGELRSWLMDDEL